MLARHFLKKRNIHIDENAVHMLQSYRWPGNVRELENVLERAAIICGGHTINAQHLPPEMRLQQNVKSSLVPASSIAAPSVETLSLPDAVQALEIRFITEALQQANGNKSRAAKLLNISERSLWYKLSRYHLTDVNDL
jgi:two-component system response regulator AtoC